MDWTHQKNRDNNVWETCLGRFESLTQWKYHNEINWSKLWTRETSNFEKCHTHLTNVPWTTTHKNNQQAAVDQDIPSSRIQMHFRWMITRLSRTSKNTLICFYHAWVSVQICASGCALSEMHKKMMTTYLTLDTSDCSQQLVTFLWGTFSRTFKFYCQHLSVFYSSIRCIVFLQIKIVSSKLEKTVAFWSL